MASGKFSPGSLFLDFGVSQSVVVGGDIGFERSSPLFPFFLLKEFIESRRLGIGASTPRFLLQIGEAGGRESKCAPLLDR